MEGQKIRRTALYGYYWGDSRLEKSVIDANSAALAGFLKNLIIFTRESHTVITLYIIHWVKRKCSWNFFSLLKFFVRFIWKMYIVEGLDASLKFWSVEDLTPKSKGVVSSYQIGLTLSSVAETDLKTNQSQSIFYQ